MDLKGSQMVTDRIRGLVRALRPTPPTALQAVVQRSGAARSLVMKFRPPCTRQDIYRWRFCDGSTVDERRQALVTHRPFTEAGFIDAAGGAGSAGTPTKKGGERVVRDSLLIYQVERAGDGSTVCRNLKCTVPNKAGVFCFRMSQLMVGTEYAFRVRAGAPPLSLPPPLPLSLSPPPSPSLPLPPLPPSPSPLTPSLPPPPPLSLSPPPLSLFPPHPPSLPLPPTPPLSLSPPRPPLSPSRPHLSL
jgi:hypothetical protein